FRSISISTLPGPHEPVGCHPGIELKSLKDPAMTGSSKLPFTISEPDGAAAWALERPTPRTNVWAMIENRYAGFMRPSPLGLPLRGSIRREYRLGAAAGIVSREDTVALLPRNGARRPPHPRRRPRSSPAARGATRSPSPPPPRGSTPNGPRRGAPLSFEDSGPAIDQAEAAY